MLYLEDYLETVETLPQDMQHSLTRMREMDLRGQNILDSIEKKQEAYYATIKKTKPEVRDQTFEAVRQDYAKALEFSEEKMTLVNQTYDQIDRQIRRLDQELKLFASELEADNPGLTVELEKRSLLLDQKIVVEEDIRPHKKRKASAAVALDDDAHDVSDKPLKTPKGLKSSLSAASFADLTGGGDGSASLTASGLGRKKKLKVALEDEPPVEPLLAVPMPPPEMQAIDPTEPRYCICNQVSFGEMVACDNEDCALEWFHYACVGITEPPKGKWYCEECTASMRRRGIFK
eukprot:Opistho-2@38460